MASVAALVRALRQAGLIMLGLMAWSTPAFPETGPAHTDVELRYGYAVLCGTCDDREGFIDKWQGTVQLFADRLFPLATIGPGSLEIGPYVKGALLAGLDIPQVAGGLALGYRAGRYEAVINGGLGYATERIGDTSTSSGQTKHTYDLGVTLRYDFERFFLSAGYQHNSNGEHLGLDFFQGKGENPGYDNIFVGAGVRF